MRVGPPGSVILEGVRTLVLTTFAVAVAAAAAVPATAGTSPALRIGTTTSLTLIGTGFKPKALVTLRVVGPEIARRVTLRTGLKGGFTYRFPTLERCSPNLVLAQAGNGVGARVPLSWFVRECPPPPPLQPGIAGA